VDALASPGHASALTWTAHPDVWLLVIVLVAGYFGAIRFLSQGRVPIDEEPATQTQKLFFLSGVVMLWIGADWPLHDVSEDFLFSAHMVQHTLFSLVAPPLLLLGMPAWMLRRLLATLKLERAFRLLTRPLVALLLFNVVIVVTHMPTVVDTAVGSELAHFFVHTVLFSSSVLMWWPVVDPLPELRRLSEPGKMLYLFLQSIVPTVPASFLTFSDGILYESYAAFPRLWGIDVVTDQRMAGLLMKIGGGLLLWLAIAILFFRWNANEERQEEVEEVTWDDFERELQAWDLRK
jgi:putative membrane protein